MFLELRTGVRLFYTDDGSGDTTLLLVHGWGADSHQWVHHLPALAREHRVIAVDLRGHGYSTCLATGNTVGRMTLDLVELLQHLGVARCVPVGHSMGAVIVSRLAVEHPSLVAALVAVDPGYGFPERVGALSLRLLDGLRGPDPRAAAVGIDQWCYTPASPAWLREWHRRRLLATPPHVLAEAFESLWAGPEAIGTRPAAEPYLSRRECPVLSFWSDPAQATWESGLFKHPASRTVCWPGSGHRLHEERPAEFTLVVSQWLASIHG
ncbi:alpha/beta fold hydrolase [Thermoactinospora rubra]|uniref:alpha/beta fold hydrolase n=1 Tax=Thermoactinospora rubra TaxID=1088767 RepID=UPI000A10852B|nr:alpha/beta hydrolase [Thermoactinospora rubra]